MSAVKLTASQLMVIVDCLYRSLQVANYSGMYDEKTRRETLEDVVKILDGVQLNVAEDSLNSLGKFDLGKFNNG